MHTNALIDEKSPYLRQHAHNPVDWLPWGTAAFEKARREDKPIFLSIGYSTCHWCHVMAHESFEDERVAEVLNRDFVPIKIDREERPDVDRIYMLFVQASTGSGGWPMSVWLTPELRPFFGGTYFPPDSRYGRPGFLSLLQHLANAWRTERDRIEAATVNVLDQLTAITRSAHTGEDINDELFGAAFHQFRRSFDIRWGGFDSAPKFPRPVALNYLLRYHSVKNSAEALEMVDETLRGMAHGGMHDHLGGGFHRYSVDERWFVPHFEKMLYDQAQLAIAYLEAFQISHHPFLSEVARGIFEYVLRDMTDPSGGFFSAEDADSARPENPSEHGEGAFYVWTKAEIDSALGPDAIPFCLRYGIEDNGNVAQDPQAEFTGRNILYLARTLTEVTARTDIETLDEPLTRAKQKLFDIRSARPRPHLDNKILTAWNALMISALVKGYSVLRETRYLDAAERAASFLLSALYDRPAKRLLRRFCDGDAAVSAFLDDYAFLAQALLDLFEATGKAEYLERSVAFANAILEKFEDPQNGGFFSTEAVSDDLLLRIKDDYDGAEPSGNSVATDVLLRLAHLSGNGAFRTSAEKSLRAFAAKLRAQPTIAPQMLVAAGRMLSAPRQIVIRCAEMSAEVHDLLAPYQHDFQPWSVVLALTDEAALRLRDLAPFLASLERKGRITIYECHNFTCDLPKVIE